jgi:hypothetical protein
MTSPVRVVGDIHAAPTSHGNALGATVQIARPIVITTDPALRNLMLHEFSKEETQSDGTTEIVFDPAPLQRYIDGLTTEQRDFLRGYDLRRKDNQPARRDRLVVFITDNARSKTLRMAFDDCYGSRHAPNASFAVFWCRGPGADVTLVCFTEMFFVGSFTPVFEPRTTRAPRKFCVGTVLPSPDYEHETHGHLYNRIFDDHGVDRMATNFFHGGINTLGCWSVFRNYNWPQKYFAEFEDEVYIRAYRLGPGRFAAAAGDAALQKIVPGYEFTKFAGFDHNYAYQRFFHEVLGLSYFSHNRWINDFNVTGRKLVREFPREHLPRPGALNDFNTGARNQQEREWRIARRDELKSRLDDARRALAGKALELADLFLDDRARELLNGAVDQLLKWIASAEPVLAAIEADIARYSGTSYAFLPDDGLWRDNRLGFRTTERFVPWNGSVSPDAATWADMYFYRE